jgi:hypothetical protein
VTKVNNAHRILKKIDFVLKIEAENPGARWERTMDDYQHTVKETADKSVRPTQPNQPYLDIQILNIQRVILNKLPARLNILAHQRSKDSLALGNIFQPDLQ